MRATLVTLPPGENRTVIVTLGSAPVLAQNRYVEPSRW